MRCFHWAGSGTRAKYSSTVVGALRRGAARRAEGRFIRTDSKPPGRIGLRLMAPVKGPERMICAQLVGDVG
jgi:hypothetical protein